LAKPTKKKQFNKWTREVITCWLVEQTTSSRKRNRKYETMKYIQADEGVRNAKKMKDNLLKIF